MKHRKLRIAWSVAWGLLAVLLSVLWVRSYWWMDMASFRLVPSTFAVRIISTRGVVGISVRDTQRQPIAFSVETIKTPDSLVDGFGTRMDDGWFHRGGGKVWTPFWFGVLCCVTSASAPWLWQVSRRTLLIATTLVAVVLGLVVWASRTG
jgi:hypothetical protein